MPAHFAGLLSNFVLNPILRPVLRILTGLGAIPVFRFIVRRIFRVRTTDAELERDLEMWFRGAVLMLAATANMESFLFGWTPWYQQSGETVWQTLILRLLLAIGVIESMPDEDVFCIIHRGPPKLRLGTRAGWREAWRKKKEILRGLGILHLRRATPVFAIMAVIFGGESALTTVHSDDLAQIQRLTDLHEAVGWWCYGLAITQYLIIALITQRDRIKGLLESFEREASVIRQEILIGAGASAVVSDGDEDDLNLQPGRYD